MSKNNRNRVKSFRDDLIDILPYIPNNRASQEALRSMTTLELILAFVTWRMRHVPAKPRIVRFWSGGITEAEVLTHRPVLEPFLLKVAAGEDLTSHLSLFVNKGLVLPGASPTARGKDTDAVLMREGLYHFHLGVATPSNTKGRSNLLLFSEVLEQEFRIITIANHRVFDKTSPERETFNRICHSYMARELKEGQGFMANPIMSSGNSLILTTFARRCENTIERFDPLLDDSKFIEKLYGGQPILRGGVQVTRTPKPSFKWHFEDLEFGILDRSTMVFFSLLPFFAR